MILEAGSDQWNRGSSFWVTVENSPVLDTYLEAGVKFTLRRLLGQLAFIHGMRRR